jgi:peptidoglycan lytic transglycosylase
MKKIKRAIKFAVFLLIVFCLGFIYFNIKYPVGYNSTIKEYANEYNLDPYLIASIINVESSYDKEAISPKSAKGLMQISPQTGKWASEELNIEDYSEEKLFQPKTNIMIGTWYLDRLKKEFNNNLDHILIAYNAGSGNLNKWLKNEEYCQDGENILNIPFEETEQYLIKVKHNYKVYSTVYKKYFDNTDEEKFYIDLANSMRNIIKQLTK